MSRGNLILNDILEYINSMREDLQNVKDVHLSECGAVFYMNGDDGTDFDWEMNGRCCEFVVFYKETNNLFIKVIVTSEDVVYGFSYEDNEYSHSTIYESIELNQGDAEFLANLLIQEADEKSIYDSNITDINFDAALSLITFEKTYCNSYTDDYDEDEEEDYGDGDLDYDNLDSYDDNYSDDHWDDYN